MLPAIIGGAIAIGSTAANIAVSRKNAREQREWQEKMWHEQNVYNNPVNSANRMRQAGLNPYSLTGSQAVGSAGSAGQGAVANTPPIGNPLEGALAMAQLKSISAQTDKTVNESLRILEQIKLDQQAFKMGLLSEEEYKLRVKALQEAYEDYNPVIEDIKNTIADTGLKQSQSQELSTESELNVAKKEQTLSQTLLNEAQTDFTKAQTESENLLREAKKDLLNAQSEDARASAERDLNEAAAVKFRIMFERNEDTRAQLRERREAGLYKLNKEVLQYARDLGASDAELAQIRNAVAEIWYDEDRPDIFNALLDFVHSNVRLSGSAIHSTVTK